MRKIISDTGWQKKTDPKTGDTYLERNLVESYRAPEGTECIIQIPEGLTVDPKKSEIRDSLAYCPRCDLPNLEAQALAFAAKLVIEDIKRTVDIDELEPYDPPRKLDAMSVIIKTENIMALHDAVKAVFDE